MRPNYPEANNLRKYAAHFKSWTQLLVVRLLRIHSSDDPSYTSVSKIIGSGRIRDTLHRTEFVLARKTRHVWKIPEYVVLCNLIQPQSIENENVGKYRLRNLNRREKTMYDCLDNSTIG